MGIAAGAKTFFKRNLGILAGLFLMSLALSLVTPSFLRYANIMNVLRQVSSNGILAFGMTFAIIIGGIDLSVGSVLALGGTLAAGLIVNNGVPVPAAIAIGCALGGGVGFLNGFVISRTGIPPFIVTLATMQIARGAAYVYTNGEPIRTTDPAFIALGTGSLGPIPLPVIYMLVIFGVLVVLLNRTRFGRYVYAIGGNKDAALYSGIDGKMIIVAVHSIIGLLAAFAGVVLCSRMYSGQPTIGVGFEMDAIAAVVLGGTSMSGGIGTLGGTFIGMLIIGVLNNGLNLMNINSFWQLILKGCVILLAVYIDVLKRKGKK
ncbi:MAG: ABC transporter permease [Spirochaetales bacterium]|nr:ABC transporter permease [Spirochaetales bacterium]